MTTVDVDILKKSVTAGDYASDPYAGPLHLMVNTIATGSAYGLLPIDPPPFWSYRRDDVLRGTIYAEDMWRSAVGKAISKIAALGWTVADSADSKLRTKRAQELLLQADAGQGWVPFVNKQLRDFLTTDNGQFTEIVRGTADSGGKILGLFHLDSRRCLRTGDPEIPVLYRDKQGREHEMRDYQIMSCSDMPDPGELYYGIGLCAASRAYNTIFKLAGIQRYFMEKITGNRPLGLHFVRGVTNQQIQDSLALGRNAQTSKGMNAFMGVLVQPVMADGEVSGYYVPFAEVPDGFDAKQERDNGYVIYANAIGCAVQDIQPLSGQGLGTGTQSVILDEAAEGQGLAAWRQQWTHNLNQWILPNTTTFGFATNDIRDQKAKAEVQKLRADTRGVMITNGEITAAQGLQLAVDAEDVPAEFLQQADMTPGGTLQDDEKPLSDVEPTEAEPISEPIAVKAIGDVQSLMKQELERARKLYQEVE